jgi:hypothetical protein
MRIFFFSIITLPLLLQSAFAEVRITEIFPNPLGADGDKEYIKIFSSEENEISLEGWSLDDGSKTFIFTNEILQPNTSRIIYKKESKITLQNSGNDEIITLKNPSKKVIDIVTRTGTTEEGKVLKLHENEYIWTEENKVENIDKEDITEDIKQKEEASQENIITENKKETIKDNIPFFNFLNITEIFPNPKEHESLFEWIEIYNTSSQIQKLTNWSIGKCDTKNAYNLDHIEISGNSYMILFRKDTHIILPNNGEEICLYYNKQLIQKIRYDKTPEEKSWSQQKDKTFALTASTPEESNETFLIIDQEKTKNTPDKKIEKKKNKKKKTVSIEHILPSSENRKAKIMIKNETNNDISLRDYIISTRIRTFIIPESLKKLSKKTSLILDANILGPYFFIEKRDIIRIFNTDGDLLDSQSINTEEISNLHKILQLETNALYDNLYKSNFIIRRHNKAIKIRGKTLPNTLIHIHFGDLILPIESDVDGLIYFYTKHNNYLRVPLKIFYKKIRFETKEV